MFTRIVVGAALGCSAVLLAGCESRTEPEKTAPPGEKAAPAAAGKKTPPAGKAAAGGSRAVTLHVEGMTRRLKLV
jgi:hypothetical protein